MAKKTKNDLESVTSEISQDVSDAEEVIEPAPPEDVAAEDVAAEEPVAEPDPIAEEEHHTSFAARTLQILALVVVGMVIGIWAAPRLAPLLPAGLAPIAQWLSPSNNAAIEDVDQLRITLETRLLALESLPNREEIETRLANFQTDSVNPVRSQMTALSDQVAAADSTAVESRLWALEGRVEGLIAEINGLTSSLGNIAAEGGAISADTAASISAYRTRIDGLQASLNEISSLQGMLSQRIDEVAVTAERQVTEAETLVAEANQQNTQTLTNSEIQTSLSEIASALSTGANFKAPLERIAGNTEHSIPAALAAAQNGVETLEELQSAFVPAAHNTIRAAVSNPQNSGLFAGFGSFLKSQVATRSLTPQAGNSADAVLSRMEAALLRDDLETILAEAENLPDNAYIEMADWLADITIRNDVKTGFETLRNALVIGE